MQAGSEITGLRLGAKLGDSAVMNNPTDGAMTPVTVRIGRAIGKPIGFLLWFVSRQKRTAVFVWLVAVCLVAFGVSCPSLDCDSKTLSSSPTKKTLGLMQPQYKDKCSASELHSIG
jgi:hypothetical protein